MIDLFLIDDHDYLNQGITVAFDNQDYKINVVGSSTSGEDALEQLKQIDVDVVLLDIVMPEMNGITCCKLIKEQFPGIKIIAFTGELDPKLLLKMWLQNVDAILVKTCGTDELASIIKSVCKGKREIGKGVPYFFDYVGNDFGDIPKLTPAELEVLKLLGLGLSRNEVAIELNRSKYTIEFHCKNLYIKFNTNRIHTVLAEARRARIIK